MEREARVGRDFGGVVTGIILMTLGVLFLLDHFGYAELGAWWRLWPLAVIAIGLGKLFSPGNGRQVGDGVTFVLLGLSFFAINYGLYGLDWSNGWPLFIVSAGAGMVVRALIPDRKEARGA